MNKTERDFSLLTINFKENFTKYTKHGIKTGCVKITSENTCWITDINMHTEGFLSGQ